MTSKQFVKDASLCFPCPQIIPGREQCGIEGLSWVGERLFSAGLNGGITEYDLTNQKVKYTIDAYGGPIWTITGNQQGTHLAVGWDPIMLFKHQIMQF